MLISGVFTCSADNGVGQPDTASITLTVECKYQIFSLAIISLSLANINLSLVFVSSTKSLFLVSHNLISSMSALCWVRLHNTQLPLCFLLFQNGISYYCVIFRFTDDKSWRGKYSQWTRQPSLYQLSGMRGITETSSRDSIMQKINKILIWNIQTGFWWTNTKC